MRRTKELARPNRPSVKRPQLKRPAKGGGKGGGSGGGGGGSSGPATDYSSLAGDASFE